MSSTRRYISLLLVALATACGGRTGIEEGAQPAPRAGVPVAVTNYNWLDVTVYAVRSGIRYRLGTVGTAQTATLAVPPELAGTGEVRLLLDPIGGRPFLTEPILVARGQRIELRIENHLPLTNWMVR